jgi:membrane-associated phospholipid phosphatase
MSGAAVSPPPGGTTVRRGEQPLLPAPRAAAAAAAAVAVLTALVFIAVAAPAAFSHVQRADDAFLRFIVSVRAAPLTLTARFFNLLGLVYVTLPVRLAIAGWLALRRRWWHLAAFGAAVVSSEVLIGTLKSAYGRARPPGSLVTTSGASFPSGHSVAAAVTAVAAVIALVPRARWQAIWGVLAVAFSAVMALSRAYLGAHWLSDAVGGLLLGTSCALLAAVAVDRLQRRRGRHTVGSTPVTAFGSAGPAGPDEPAPPVTGPLPGDQGSAPGR